MDLQGGLMKLMRLTTIDCLKPGDTFLNIQDNTVYKLVSEGVDDRYLCCDEDGFGQMFNGMHIVRAINRQ